MNYSLSPSYYNFEVSYDSQLFDLVYPKITTDLQLK